MGSCLLPLLLGRCHQRFKSIQHRIDVTHVLETSKGSSSQGAGQNLHREVLLAKQTVVHILLCCLEGCEARGGREEERGRGRFFIRKG